MNSPIVEYCDQRFINRMENNTGNIQFKAGTYDPRSTAAKDEDYVNVLGTYFRDTLNIEIDNFVHSVENYIQHVNSQQYDAEMRNKHIIDKSVDLGCEKRVQEEEASRIKPDLLTAYSDLQKANAFIKVQKSVMRLLVMILGK